MSMTPENIALLSIAVILGVVALLQFLRRPRDLSGELAVLQERLDARQQELESRSARIAALEQELGEQAEAELRLREQLVKLETTLSQERRQTEEKLALLNDTREQMSLQFKALASEILEDKSRRFTDSNRENIAQILKPLSEKIQSFEKRVEETYDRESKERFSLTNEIRSLQELNARISEDAVNLTNALKGESKTQGTWGEVILETILEKSGLVKGREYQTQVNLKAEDGARSQPDVIVHLPENKQIIIDAKVSLKAYEAYCSEDDPERRSTLLRDHVQSVRNHIRMLSSKEYQNLQSLQTLDFVLLFMPVEPAFSVAVQADGEMFTDAFEKNIILVGPSTLLATLRAIRNIWRHEQQNQNALEIARSAGALYDKFVAFASDLDEIGTRIDATRKSFDKAQNKLVSGRGNLVNRAEKLLQLGARASKQQSEELLSKAGLDESALEDSSASKDSDESDVVE